MKSSGRTWSSILKVSIALLCLCFAQAKSEESLSSLEAAAQALNAKSITTISFLATGANFAFGQAYAAGDPWPRFNLKTYEAEIDYTTPAMRIEWERTIPPQTPPPGLSANPMIWKGGGGAPPFTLPQRPDLMPVHMIQAVSGQSEWNVLGSTIPVFSPLNARLLEIWETPVGIIKAAQAAGEKNVIKRGDKGETFITFPVAGAFVTATIDAQHFVSRVMVAEENPVLGDTSIETIYSGYRDFGGVKFPTRILRKEGEFPVLELAVKDARFNVPVNIKVPQGIESVLATAKPTTLNVEPTKIGDGVYRMEGPGLSYHSVAVEFKDYSVVIEGPVGDDVALAIIDATKKAIPNKPIKYVVNTHVHFDHSGGLRAFVAEGATVITQALNKPYYEKVWARPHTIHPDKLARFPRAAVIESVNEKRVITDGNQRVELYHLSRIWHNEALVAAYIPKLKLLVVPDLFEGLPKEPAPPNPEFQDLFDEIQRWKLDVSQISPLHAPSLETMDDLRNALVDRSKTRD